MESNKEIMIMFDKFNKCINQECNNCLNHSSDIKKYYNKINIKSGYNETLSQYNKLTKIINEFNSIVQLYIRENMIKIQKEIEFFELNLKHVESQICYYTNYNLNIQSNTKFKNKIDEHINICIQNNILLDIENNNCIINIQYNKLLKQIKKFDKYMIILTELKQIYKINDQQILEYHNNNENYNENLRLNKLIDDNKIKINNFVSNKQLYNKYNENIVISQNIIKEVSESITNLKYNQHYNGLIKETREKINQLNIDHIGLSNNINIDDNNLEKLIVGKIKYEKCIISINKIENEIELFSIINKLVGPSSIPRKIINIKLQHIENEVNSTIFTFINKKIHISKDIDDIKIYLVDGTNKIPFGGGMESFIITLAFKIGFITVFNIPSCSLLVIDEGVSVLDKEHVNKFNIICNFIKKFYNHILLITHIDAFNDFTIDNIEIVKHKKTKQSSVLYI